MDVVPIKSVSRPSGSLHDNLSLALSSGNHEWPGSFTTPATPDLHSHSLGIVMLFVQYKHFWMIICNYLVQHGCTGICVHTILMDGWARTCTRADLGDSLARRKVFTE